MKFRSLNGRSLFFLGLAASVCLVAAAAEKAGLKPLEKAPDGLSKKVAGAIDPKGYRLEVPDGPSVEFWLAKDLAVKPGFNPTLNVKYPFTPGQLVGALRVPEGSQFSDFRGQELAPGAYTLRYSQQPLDGNHIGTSETSDFLLALPAKVDEDPKPVAGPDQLSQSSAKSVGSMHPAIFSLLPVEEKSEKPTLTHDEGREFWIVNLTADVQEKEKPAKLPMRFVIVGRALE